MQRYTKILFVGDLRTAYNYGAIATTEALLDLIGQNDNKFELRLIDYRSFRGTTPASGWEETNYLNNINNPSQLKSKVISITRKIGIYELIHTLRHGKELSDKWDNVPTRYDEYKSFAEKILRGETWRYEKELLEWSDVVIINSEGNIVNGTDEKGIYRIGGRYVLFMEYLAKVIFNKPCYVINHTVDPKNRDIKKIIFEIYSKLDGVYVREKKSLELLKTMNITNVTYVPDALWSHEFENDIEVNKPLCLRKIDMTKPYICVGDSSGICNRYSHVKWDVVKTYTKLIKMLKEQVCPTIIFIDGYNGGNNEINSVVSKNHLPTVNLSNCSYHELYYILKHASIFISGRWHASIISLMANTPILLWGADSHKTEALYDEIDYEYEFFDVASLPLNVDRIVAEAKKIVRDDHDKYWEKVEKLKLESKNNIQMLL